MIYLGIDPGTNTGIGVVTSVTSAFSVTCRREDFAETLIDIISPLEGEILIGVEKAVAMRRQDLNVGISYGIVLGGLSALSLTWKRLGYVDVAIISWQKSVLGKFPKGESKIKAKQYIGQRFGIAKRSEHENDALCIACYLRDKEERKGRLYEG